jgi:putative transposase
MGSVGDCYDASMAESFWSRVRVELFNRKRWKTRVELATVVFKCLEIFHERGHCSLGMITPVEFELRRSAGQSIEETQVDLGRVLCAAPPVKQL